MFLKHCVFLYCIQVFGAAIFHVPSIAAICPDGYSGKHCDIRCSFPYYGFGCQTVCLCPESRCHFSTGCQFHIKDVNIQNEKQESTSTKGHEQTAIKILTQISEGQTKIAGLTQTETVPTNKPIRTGKDRSSNIYKEEITLKSNANILDSSVAVNGNTGKRNERTAFNWTKNSWIGICLIISSVALFVLIILHGVIHYVMKRRNLRQR